MNYIRNILVFTALSLLPFTNALSAQRQMEKLDRGLVAVKNGNSVFISWRFLATDDPKYKFNVYKNGTQKINLLPIATSTNVVDNSNALVSDSYTVRTILNGVEIDTSEAVNPWPTIYKTIHRVAIQVMFIWMLMKWMGRFYGALILALTYVQVLIIHNSWFMTWMGMALPKLPARQLREQKTEWESTYL